MPTPRSDLSTQSVSEYEADEAERHDGHAPNHTLAHDLVRRVVLLRGRQELMDADVDHEAGHQPEDDPVRAVVHGVGQHEPAQPGTDRFGDAGDEGPFERLPPVLGRVIDRDRDTEALWRR